MAQIFLTQLVIILLFKFPPHPMSVCLFLHYLGKTDQAKYVL